MQRSAQTIGSPALSNTPRTPYYSELARDRRSPYSPYTPTGHGQHSPFTTEVVTTQRQCRRYVVQPSDTLHLFNLCQTIDKLNKERMTCPRPCVYGKSTYPVSSRLRMHLSVWCYFMLAFTDVGLGPISKIRQRLAELLVLLYQPSTWPHIQCSFW